MSLTDSMFLIFSGILVSDIIYQSGILTKLYAKIGKIEQKVFEIEYKIEKK